MALVSKPFTFSSGAVIIASQHNSDFDTLYNLVNGALDGTNLASNAAIADTQLGAITTAGKVAGGAITLASTSIVTAASNDYLLIGDTSDSGNPKKALVSDISFTPTAANALSGSVIKVVSNVADSTFGPSANLAFGAVATGTTVLPIDDSTPQKTEGDQYMTKSITPAHASNKLVEVVMQCSHTTTPFGIALFWDAGTGTVVADALTGTICTISNSGDYITQSFSFFVVAGSTNATVFTVRAGAGSGTFTFNGTGGNRKFGGVLASLMTISEIKA